MDLQKASRPASDPAPVELSVVIPVYYGEPFVETLVSRIEKNIPSSVATFEIILVDDGSPDDSWKKIESACRSDFHVKGIKLSRNFGQHNAITAGLLASRGRNVILMDCDLQDDPAYLPALL